MRAVGSSDGQEDVLRRYAVGQLAGEVVAHGFADAEPRLARSHGPQHVRTADATRGAIERARRAGVGIAIHQHGAGHRIGAIGHHGMADTLVRADIVQPLDTETCGERAADAMRVRSLDGRRRHQVVEDDGDLFRVVNLQDFAPAFRQEAHVHQHCGFHVDHSDVAGLDRAAAARARQDLLGHGHAHGRSSLRFVVLRPA